MLFSIAIQLSNRSLAAEQGNKDEDESIGNIYIDLEIGEITSISNLDNFDFTDWELNDDVVEQSDDVCVYSNKLANTQYTITASGTGTGSSFAVTSSTGNEEIPYLAYWNDRAKTDSGRKQIRANTPLTNQKKANTKAFDCEGKDNARISIAFTKTDLDAVVITGLYSGTLFISISPE